MFNRERDPSENIWPNRNLRDRIFANSAQNRSSDPVIQQLREDFDKHRQMFFDRMNQPHWENLSRGFPFSDIPRRFGTDRQYPNFDGAENWVEDNYSDQRQRRPSSGSGRSSCSSTSSDNNGFHGNNAEMGSGLSESPTGKFHESPKLHKPATRSATGDFPQCTSDEDEATRGCRASSAPPMNCNTPRRFTTSIQMPCNDVRNQTKEKLPETEKGLSVRHIPIFVEGRDEPVLPRVLEEDSDSQKSSQNRKQQPTEKSSSTPAVKLMAKHPDDQPILSKKPIPMPFYGLTPEKDNDVTEAQEDRNTHPSAPIPLPYPTSNISSDAPCADQNSSQTFAIPMSCAGRVNLEPSNENDQSDLLKMNELSKIANIQQDVEALCPRIETFCGPRNDREFLYLDEMLTRLLLRLDDVKVEGREDVRQARRQAISSIQRCITLLESRVGNGFQNPLDLESSDDQGVKESIATLELNDGAACITTPLREECHSYESV